MIEAKAKRRSFHSKRHYCSENRTQGQCEKRKIKRKTLYSIYTLYKNTSDKMPLYINSLPVEEVLSTLDPL